MSIDSIKPVFFTGQMRSGGTLLTRIIDQSDEIKVAYDTVHYLRFAYSNYNPLCDNYKKLLMDMNSRLSERWDLSIDVETLSKELSSKKDISEAIVYDEIMKSFLNIEKDTNVRWGDRTAVRWEGIKPFLNMFPNGKAVHIYRDPRALLASYKHMTYLPEPMYLDIVFSTLAMFNYISDDSIRKNDNVYLIKYEELIENPELEIKKLCLFLEIEYKPSMLKVDQFKNFKGEKFDTDSSFTEQKISIDTSSKYIWKDKLTNVDVYLTEMILKKHMLTYGYELSAIDLDKDEFSDLYDLLHDEYILKRYTYWLKNCDGCESHPEDSSGYETSF